MLSQGANKLCIGCTLGPIFSTLNKARTPLEIWMASYLFSRLAELIVGHVSADPRVELISPSREGCEIARKVRGVGLYSDHIFFELHGAEDEGQAHGLLSAAKEKALAALAAEMAASIADKRSDAQTIAAWLDQAVFLLPAIRCLPEEQPAPISELTDALDLLECYPPYIDRSSADRPDFIEQYLIHLTQGRSGWIREQGVSMAAFNRLMRPQSDTTDDGDRLDNYLVLVQADGDNVGKFLAGLSARGEIGLMRQVSTFLFDRGQKNAELVQHYGAVPVYFGGDDMLFMAPVMGQAPDGSPWSVFQLIQELESRFERSFDDLVRQDPAFTAVPLPAEKPALSFGMAICHQRYPLMLIRETAASALFGTAKHVGWTAASGVKRSKKAVVVTLRKHSGQTSSICMEASAIQGNSAFSHFVDMTHSALSQMSLHALHWKLMEQKTAVSYLLMLPDKKVRATRLKAWLEQNFNEEKPLPADLDRISAFLCAVADDLWDGSEDPLAAQDAAKAMIDTIDGAFRLFEFLKVNSKKEDEQP